MLEGLDTPTIDAPDAQDSAWVPRDLVQRLQSEVKFQQTKIEALNVEIARLKRWRFGSSAESLDSSAQAVLFDQILADTAQEDRAANEAGKPSPPPAARGKRQPVRRALPAHLPRIDHHHEIEAPTARAANPSSASAKKSASNLDCVPAQFFVHRHICGKWACACCQTIQAAPMPAQMIDKGIPAPGLLAQVVVAKHDDHLPLYRQEEIYAHSGVHIARSSMAQWIGICGVRLAPLAAALREYILAHDVIHADETPVAVLAVLAPGKGKTKRAYVWVYRTTNFVAPRAGLFDLAPGRGGENPRRILGGFAGTLVNDDYAGYHALHANGVRAALCMAHARRKLFEAHKLNGSQIAGEAVIRIAGLYEIERQARELEPQERLALRQQHASPLAEALHARLADPAARPTGQSGRDGPRHRLLAEQLACAHALPGRWQRADRQQRGRERDTSAVRGPQLCEPRSYANSPSTSDGLPSAKGLDSGAATSHDHNAYRN